MSITRMLYVALGTTRTIAGYCRNHAALHHSPVDLERWSQRVKAAFEALDHGPERTMPDDVASVMIVGHNPGLEDLVRGLGRDGDASLIARVHTKFPTAALATLTFDGSWKELGSGAPARLEGFVVPGDLP